jgi:hypothetical protein
MVSESAMVLRLVGIVGKDVVLEGRELFEFWTFLKRHRQYLDYPRLELAVRVIGTDCLNIQRGEPMPGGEQFGVVCGRTWTAQYGE